MPDIARATRVARIARIARVLSGSRAQDWHDSCPESVFHPEDP